MTIPQASQQKKDYSNLKDNSSQMHFEMSDCRSSCGGGNRWLERSFLMDSWQVLTSWFGLCSLMQTLSDDWLSLRTSSLQRKDCLFSWKGGIMSCWGQDQIGSKIQLFRVETVITLAQQRDLDVAGRCFLNQRPPHPSELYILPQRLFFEVLLADIPQGKMTRLFLQFDDIHLAPHSLNLLLQLFILLEHLACPLLVVLYLILEIQDLCIDVFGSDEVGIHLDDVLRFLLDLFDLRVCDLDYLLLVDCHPCLEQLVEVGYVPAQGFEVVEDGLIQLYF